MQKESLVKPSSVNLQMQAGTLWVSAGLNSTAFNSHLYNLFATCVQNSALEQCVPFLQCLMMEMRKRSEERHCVLRVKGILQRVR